MPHVGEDAAFRVNAPRIRGTAKFAEEGYATARLVLEAFDDAVKLQLGAVTDQAGWQYRDLAPRDGPIQGKFRTDGTRLRILGKVYTRRGTAYLAIRADLDDGAPRNFTSVAFRTRKAAAMYLAAMASQPQIAGRAGFASMNAELEIMVDLTIDLPEGESGEVEHVWMWLEESRPSEPRNFSAATAFVDEPISNGDRIRQLTNKHNGRVAPGGRPYVYAVVRERNEGIEMYWEYEGRINARSSSLRRLGMRRRFPPWGPGQGPR